MGAERGVRSVPVHARRRGVDEQAPRRRLIGALVATAVAATSVRAYADPPKRPPLVDPSGTPVTITASDPHTVIWLAKGDVDQGAPSTAFEKMGEAPVEVKLAPGTYTLESEEPSSSLGHARFSVDQGQPVHILVKNGNAIVRTSGSALVGAGIIAMLLGVVAMVSISNDDKNYSRWGISIPLLAGGAVGVGVGVGLLGAGATTFDSPAMKQARGLSFGVSF